MPYFPFQSIGDKDSPSVYSGYTGALRIIRFDGYNIFFVLFYRFHDLNDNTTEGTLQEMQKNFPQNNEKHLKLPDPCGIVTKLVCKIIRKECTITMSGVKIFFTILQVLSGLCVTVIVLMQSGKSAGLSGAVAGGAENFFAKGKAKSWDEKLAKMTKWFALAFVLLTLILNLI